MNGVRIVCDTNPIIYLLDGNKDIAKSKIHIINLSVVCKQREPGGQSREYLKICDNEARLVKPLEQEKNLKK